MLHFPGSEGTMTNLRLVSSDAQDASGPRRLRGLVLLVEGRSLPLLLPVPAGWTSERLHLRPHFLAFCQENYGSFSNTIDTRSENFIQETKSCELTACAAGGGGRNIPAGAGE